MVSALRVYVMRLRQVLGEPRLIGTTSTGYVLRLPDQDLDLGRFECLAARGLAASAAGELDTAEASFGQALAEWRGPALADVESEFLHRVEVPQLQERKLDIEAARNDVVLRKGGHRGLIAPLRQLTEQYPFREKIWAQLMLALYRSGRWTEAMDAYGAVRDLLADRLGIDPGQEVESLYSAILSRDPSLDFTAEARDSSTVTTPSQVAPLVPDFVGRAAEADVIGELLVARDTDVAMPVVTLCGPPGVGKTSLAAFVARQLRARFPDGQLFADLRGCSEQAPRPMTRVLAGFLRALGVPPAQVPTEQDEQAAVYRALLDGRQVLVVLDDAASAEQVRPLLPGSPGSAVIVTSRHELRSLIVTNDAHLVPLGVLPPDAALDLLARLLGEDVVAGQLDAVHRLAELCGHLPLALRIAAANLVSGSQLDVESYVRKFRSGNLLDSLAAEGDEVTARASFDLSYAKLPPTVQRTFHMAGLVPGPDFTPEAVAVLMRVPVPLTARNLESLATANFVQRRPGGRYQLHDLLQQYALLRRREQMSADETEATAADLMAESREQSAQTGIGADDIR